MPSFLVFIHTPVFIPFTDGPGWDQKDLAMPCTMQWEDPPYGHTMGTTLNRLHTKKRKTRGVTKGRKHGMRRVVSHCLQYFPTDKEQLTARCFLDHFKGFLNLLLAREVGNPVHPGLATQRNLGHHLVAQ